MAGVVALSIQNEEDFEHEQRKSHYTVWFLARARSCYFHVSRYQCDAGYTDVSPDYQG